MTDSLRKLAAEFKQFLTVQGENLISAAAPSRAAARVSAVQVPPSQPLDVAQTADAKTGPAVASQISTDSPTSTTAQTTASVPPMQEGSTLTVEFKANVSPRRSFPAPDASNTMQKQQQLDQIAQTIKACSRCPLGSARLNAVPGEGNPDTAVMFVGEGPGYDEDRQGRPFVGRAGQLLDKMILAMGLSREKVFIANIAKCHPMIDPLHPEKHGNDRPPNAEEIACCRKYIEQQIAVVCPQYVVALGLVAARALIGDVKSMSAVRGKFYDLHLDSVTLPKPVKVLATFHPAALLRNPNWKKDAWADLQIVMDALGLKGARK